MATFVPTGKFKPINADVIDVASVPVTPVTSFKNAEEYLGYLDKRTGDIAQEIMQTRAAPKIYYPPEKDFATALAKYNRFDPTLSSWGWQKIKGYRDYFKTEQGWEPGGKNATSQVATQAERQWAKDAQGGGFGQFLSIIAPIALAATGVGGGLALAMGGGYTGAMGSGALIGGVLSAATGGDVGKGMILGSIGGGFSQFAKGFDTTKNLAGGTLSTSNLVNAGGSIAKATLAGSNPLTAGAQSLIGSIARNETGSAGIGTGAALATGLILSNRDVSTTVRNTPIDTSSPKMESDYTGGFSYAVPKFKPVELTRQGRKLPMRRL